jgi:hypothetical protein
VNPVVSDSYSNTAMGAGRVEIQRLISGGGVVAAGQIRIERIGANAGIVGTRGPVRVGACDWGASERAGPGRSNLRNIYK